MYRLPMNWSFLPPPQDFGVHAQIELAPGGQKQVVTEENKENYVSLLAEYKIKKGIAKQIEHFLEGFHELIPPNWIGVFTPNELELLISGMVKRDSSN